MRTRARAESRRGGFTLLEVMIATVILAMLVFTLHRFISTTLTALQFTTEISEERREVQAVTDLVRSLLNDLPAATPGVLTGKAIKLKDLPCDEMTWLCRAGEGVMTEAAPGDYRVTLTVQPSEKNTAELELGLRRELVTKDAGFDASFFQRGGGTNKYNWLPLIRPVAALQIRYWDARLNSPLAQWNDANARPHFVHVKIWKTADSLPHDVILPVPSARLQQAQ